MRTIPSRVINNYNGTYTVEYTPTEVGYYQIEMTHNDAPVEGTPVIAKAYDPAAIVIGQISNGVVGSPVEFTSKCRNSTNFIIHEIFCER